jgi:hypothetical protein
MDSLKNQLDIINAEHKKEIEKIKNENKKIKKELAEIKEVLFTFEKVCKKIRVA